MQLLFTMLLDVRSICTLVNKPLHVFHITAAALKTTQAVVWQPQTSPGEGWGYRAVCWEQQRDLRAVNPAPATQEIVSGYFVLSHLLPWLHCQRGFKDIWMSVQAPEIPNSAVWKSSPWAASPSECCCWPVHTCHFSGTSCVPREHPLPSTSAARGFCSTSQWTHPAVFPSNVIPVSVSQVTQQSPWEMLFIFSISAFL